MDNVFNSREESDTYLLAIESWIADIPTPGSEKTQDVGPDKVDVLASKLSKIITNRDADIFPEFYFDPEAESAAIERRPYNLENLGVG